MRNKLLRSAAQFYDKLGVLPGRESDFISRRELAAANSELAWLMVKVGRPEEGPAAHPSPA